MLIPIAVPIILLLWLFNIGQLTDRSAEEVAGFIRDFLEDSGGDWDWDDFISVTIKNPELESIRDRASMIELPLTTEGTAELKKLLAEAQELQKKTRL